MTEYSVKIVMYNGYHADKVVYYRNRLPMRLIEKYRWYFEYLVVKVKVYSPRQKVELKIVPQTLLQGSQYVEQKTKTLLKAKKIALKKCDKEIIFDDLFSSKKEEQEKKRQKLQDDIKALENGEFNYYIPATYINLIQELTD